MILTLMLTTARTVQTLIRARILQITLRVRTQTVLTVQTILKIQTVLTNQTTVINRN